MRGREGVNEFYQYLKETEGANDRWASLVPHARKIAEKTPPITPRDTVKNTQRKLGLERHEVYQHERLSRD